MDAFTCESCDSEFFVDVTGHVGFCPLCGDDNITSDRDDWIDDNGEELYDEE